MEQLGTLGTEYLDFRLHQVSKVANAKPDKTPSPPVARMAAPAPRDRNRFSPFHLITVAHEFSLGTPQGCDETSDDCTCFPRYAQWAVSNIKSSLMLARKCFFFPPPKFIRRT